MFFKKKKEKTPKTSNRKVVPNMKPIEELRTNKDIAEWCRDFFRVTDSLCPDGCSEKSIWFVPSATCSWRSRRCSSSGCREKT